MIPFLNFEIIKVIPVFTNIEPLNNVTIPSEINENVISKNTTPIIETIDYIPYIFWSFYSLITFLLLGRFIKNGVKLISKTKSNHIVKYKNAKLVLVDEKIPPHTFLNYIFINFEDYNNRSIEDELLTHELVHVKQKHSLDILFIEFLKVLFWFNPIYIFYKKAIQLNHEFLADDMIVKTYNNVPFYQNLLLQKVNGNQKIYLASNLNYLVTKKRLIMMTKRTSQKIALLKKVSIVPILSVIIYFFCIEVVSQQKVININSKSNTSELTDKDKIRDSYYSNVRICLKDKINNISINKMYEDLSLEEKRKYLNWVPDMIIEKEVPKPLFEKMKVKNMAIWINGKVISKEELKKFKRTDFSYYTYSFVHKNARTKRFPQEHQYTLYTKKYFDENLNKSLTTKYKFIESGQLIAKNITGCAGAFTPFSSLNCMKLASYISDYALNQQLGFVSLSGNHQNANKNGVMTTPFYAVVSSSNGINILSIKEIYKEVCPCCNT